MIARLGLGLTLMQGCANGRSPGSQTKPTIPAPSAPPSADRPLMRRLTHAQYDNTIRELLGITGDPASAFAEDENQAGFAVNSTLPVQDLQLEQYQDAAEALAATVVGKSLSALVGCSPSGAAEAACTESFIRNFGGRAYRRPLSNDELTAYLALFKGARQTGDFASGVSLVLRAMLQSPYFLYRVELGAPGAAPEADGALPLTGYEIASRLSYFIWNSMPDATLLAAAAANQLNSADQVSAMASQMLTDERARDAVTSFHEQWLGLNGFDSLEKSDPSFTPELRAAMHEEVDDFSDYVLRSGDGRLETLLSANFSLISAPVFSLYGVTPVPGQTATQVFQAGLPPTRLGILTSAAGMAMHAHVDQTSLVHRGKLLREQLLCTQLPPPPADVDTTPPPVDPDVSARVRFEQHTQSAACSGCHGQMDPLGTPFESYDAIGRYRTLDGTQPVDSTGTLTGSASHDGAVSDALDLVKRLSVDDNVRGCMAAQWFRYVFGRIEDDTDRATIASAYASFAHADFRIPDLLVALTATRTFRFRRPGQTQ